MKLFSIFILILAMQQLYAVDFSIIPKHTTIDFSVSGRISGIKTDTVLLTGIHDNEHSLGKHELIIVNNNIVISKFALPANESCYDKIMIMDFDHDNYDEIIFINIDMPEPISIYKYANNVIKLIKTSKAANLTCKNERKFKISVKRQDEETFTSINYNIPSQYMPSIISSVFSVNGEIKTNNSPVAKLTDIIIENEQLISIYNITVNNKTVAICRVPLNYISKTIKFGEISLCRYIDSDELNSKLRFIDTTNTRNAVFNALNFYNFYFPETIYSEKIKGINAFLKYQNELIEIENKYFVVNYDKHRKDIHSKFKDANLRYEKLKTYINTYNNSKTNMNAGFIAVYTGEGEWHIQKRNSFLSHSLKGLPEDAKQYFSLIDEITTEPVVRDGGIVILISKIYNRILSSENFITSFPDSAFINDVYKVLFDHLTLLTIGTDNSPVYDWNTRVIKPSVKNELKKYSEFNQNTITKYIAKQIYNYWEKNGFIFSSVILNTTNSYLSQIDSEKISSYYPINKDIERHYLICGDIPHTEIYRFTGKSQCIFSSLNQDGKFTEENIKIGDTVYNESLNRILIHEPVRCNTTWKSDGITYRIKAIGQSRQIADVRFHNVMNIIGTNANNKIIEESYYAAGIGLIEKNNFDNGKISQMILLSAFPLINEKSSFDNKISSMIIKSQDIINMNINDKNVTIIDIKSKTGIGKAELTKANGTRWPDNMIITFNSIYMESFRIDCDKNAYNLSYTTEKQIIEEQSFIENGKSKSNVINKNSPLWFKVDVSKDNFRIFVPNAVLKDEIDNIKLSWIDQYR